MNNFTINILPENFKPLPVIFDSASAFFRQTTMEYRGNNQDFYQILIVLDGEGSVYCMEEVHKLKKGCAFFTEIYTESKYIDEGNLMTAYLTVRGDGLPQILEYFNFRHFKFFENVDIERYVNKIKDIINEYYKTKNESKLSAMCYSFFTDFFENQQESTFASLDKTALYIEKNFNKMLTLSELAGINKTSVSKLCHDFKSKYGYTIFNHIINLRLNYAHNLLNSATDIKTKDVSQACGFEDVSYFCKLYKKKFGYTPLSNHL